MNFLSRPSFRSRILPAAVLSIAVGSLGLYVANLPVDPSFKDLQITDDPHTDPHTMYFQSLANRVIIDAASDAKGIKIITIVRVNEREGTATSTYRCTLAGDYAEVSEYTQSPTPGPGRVLRAPLYREPMNPSGMQEVGRALDIMTSTNAFAVLRTIKEITEKGKLDGLANPEAMEFITKKDPRVALAGLNELQEALEKVYKKTSGCTSPEHYK